MAEPFTPTCRKFTSALPRREDRAPRDGSKVRPALVAIDPRHVRRDPGCGADCNGLAEPVSHRHHSEPFDKTRLLVRRLLA